MFKINSDLLEEAHFYIRSLCCMMNLSLRYWGPTIAKLNPTALYINHYCSQYSGYSKNMMLFAQLFISNKKLKAVFNTCIWICLLPYYKV